MDTISYVESVPDWVCRMLHVIAKILFCKVRGHNRGPADLSAVCGACGEVFNVEVAHSAGVRTTPKWRLERAARQAEGS